LAAGSGLCADCCSGLNSLFVKRSCRNCRGSPDFSDETLPGRIGFGPWRRLC
jgi:hypothetical protein